MEIAAHVGTTLDGCVEGSERFADEAGAEIVVGIGETVFRNINRLSVFCQFHNRLPERLRIKFPTKIRLDLVFVLIVAAGDAVMMVVIQADEILMSDNFFEKPIIPERVRQSFKQAVHERIVGGLEPDVVFRDAYPGFRENFLYDGVGFFVGVGLPSQRLEE